MFSNGRKTIGLFIFNTHEDFQSKICQGMAERTEQLGYNLAVFSSYGKYGGNEEYFQGEMEIFNLPSYDRFAGIVVAFDTFNDADEAKELIMKNIKEHATCPVVSLREGLDGVSNVLINDRDSMEGVIRHVIEEHGKKDIAFMTGVKGRYDAEARLECFRRIMDEYGYPVGEHRVFYGDFWRGKGKEACDWFIQDGNYPEAILCANDNMALAVIDELYERGIQVPQDILVTGYDGEEEGLAYSPSLTTVDVDFNNMAFEAVNLIDRHQNDGKQENVYLSTRVVVRESCGCGDKMRGLTYKQRCVSHKMYTKKENLEMQFSFMAIDFSKVTSIEVMHEVISSYIYNIEGFKNYFICLRDDIESDTETFHGYTDTMHVRMGMTNRKNMQSIDIPFQRELFLPAEFIGEEPQCYFFYPLHFQDDYFGYEAYSYCDHDQCGKAYVRWNIAVSNAIQRILTQKKMNDLISELQNMYIQDVLTGLYNRRGFEQYARMQFAKARAEDTTVCVMGIDMDGLKPINDIYGHHEGDTALRAIGYAVQEAAVPGQIGARIGGDEFEVIFPCRDEEEVKKWVTVFEQSLENFNSKSEKPYEVHASLGYVFGVPEAGDSIEGYMKESDNIMYRNKIENKRKRNEKLR